MNRRWALAALAVLGLVLALGTLGPSPSDLFALVARGADRGGLDSVTFESVEQAANLILFVPVGFLVAAAVPRRVSGWLVWALCTALSACVELVQTALPDRHTSLLDVLLNSTGAAIGVAVHHLVAGRRHRPPAE